MPVSPSRVLMEGVEIDLAGGDMVEVGLAWDAVRGAGKIDLGSFDARVCVCV